MQYPALSTLQKLAASYEGSQIWLGTWFFAQKSGAFVGVENVVAAIDGLRADDEFRQPIQRLSRSLYDNPRIGQSSPASNR